MLKFKAGLRVWSKEYTLVQLEDVLGPSPSGHSIGDTYSRGKRKREETLWTLKSSLLKVDSFESHLNQLVDFLITNKSVLSDLRHKCEMDLFCMLKSDNGQGTTMLPYKLMKKLSDHKLDLILDVYVDDEEDS